MEYYVKNCTIHSFVSYVTWFMMKILFQFIWFIMIFCFICSADWEVSFCTAHEGSSSRAKVSCNAMQCNATMYKMSPYRAVYIWIRQKRHRSAFLSFGCFLLLCLWLRNQSGSLHPSYSAIFQENDKMVWQ